MLNVIIAEDEPISRKGLRSMLLRLRPNYDVSEASTGQKALDLYRQMKSVDLLITDIKMPGIGGLELIERIVKLPNPPLCVILSGYDYFDYAKRALVLGASDYLLKPLDEGLLGEMLGRVESKLTGQKVWESGAEFAKDCKRYIMENIGNPELSLTLLAQRYCFSTGYLSTWFKQNAGENFNKFLTRTRMEYAVKLLMEGKKVYEVAAMTGYSDPKYFDKVFKGYYSCTPEVYRRQKHLETGLVP